MVDISRGTTNVSSLLPADVSQEILAKTLENSIVQQLARRVNVPGPGLTIPVISGEPTAAWTAETARKPVSTHTLNKLTLTPKKLAVIEPFSDEFRRDLPGLYAELARRLPLSLAKKFDADALYGDRSQIGSLYSATAAASANADQQVLDATGTYQDFLDGIVKVANSGYEANGIALSPAGEALAMGATTTAGSPLFIQSAQNDSGVGSIFGRPVFRSRAVAKTGLDADGSGAGSTTFTSHGVVGDWTQAIWGTVEGVKVSFSDQAVLYVDGGVNDIHLWQQNMFAVRAEIEIGFVVADPKAFVLYTTTPA